MRPTPNLDVERYRVREGKYASSRPDGNNGQFILRAPDFGNAESPRFRTVLLCMVSDGEGWEHVSVSVKLRSRSGALVETNRCPTWEEMSHVKGLFWASEECVIQFHPRVSEYRNWHKYVLHLWRPTDARIPEPNADFVAPRPGETEEQTLARYRESA